MKYVFVPFEDTRHAFLAKAFDQSKCEYIGIPELYNSDRILFAKIGLLKRIKDVVGNIKFACKVMHLTSDNDIIIVWMFRYALWINIIKTICGRRNKVIAVNFIDHSTGAKARVKSLIYNRVFKDKNFYLSINNLDALDKYCNHYKIDRARVFELPDCYYFKMPEQEFKVGNGTILCSGNIRDWQLFYDVARILPQYKFIGIAGSDHMSQELLRNCPSNVRMLLDIPMDQFYKLLSECSISLVAVPSDIPNGLTVLLQSAFLCKPILAANTSSIKKLVAPNDESVGGSLYELGNAADCVKKIEELFSDYDLQKKMCVQMKINALGRSPEAFSRNLLNYIESNLS